MDYDIQIQITNNSLGSHEYRQLRQCWIIPSNLNYLYLIPLKFSNLNPYFLTSHLCFDSFWFSEYKSKQYLQQPAHTPILHSSINWQIISYVMGFEFLYMLDFLRIFWRIKCGIKKKMKKCINLNKSFKHFLPTLRNFVHLYRFCRVEM